MRKIDSKIIGYPTADIDESMRLVIIGEAVMDAAAACPVFASWLEHFLDMRVTSADDRYRLNLLPRAPEELAAADELIPPGV